MKDRITRTGSSKKRKPSGISRIKRSGDSPQQKEVFEKGTAAEKTFFHVRSKHRGQYDFDALTAVHSDLKPFVRPNKYGALSIDFADPAAVKELNTSLLKHHYGIDYWDIPKGFLCPPIPSRADYIHHVADLFEEFKPADKLRLKCLDIGAGANCIYSIIGALEYKWKFISTDIDQEALENIDLILKNNPGLEKNISPRLQEDASNIFNGVLKKSEKIDVVVCNPPFHESAVAAEKANQRKFKNLGLGKDGQKAVLNFGGKPTELWTFGGEKKFIHSMITESVDYAKNIMWFTSLVSKKESIIPMKKALEKVNPTQVKVIKMNQGNKSGRVLAWTFMDKPAQEKWAATRFK